jgi:hypothetical protein
VGYFQDSPVGVSGLFFPSPIVTCAALTGYFLWAISACTIQISPTDYCLANIFIRYLKFPDEAIQKLYPEGIP